MHTYINDVRSRVHTPMHAQRAKRGKKKTSNPVKLHTHTNETVKQGCSSRTWTVSSTTREPRVPTRGTTCTYSKIASTCAISIWRLSISLSTHSDNLSFHSEQQDLGSTDCMLREVNALHCTGTHARTYVPCTIQAPHTTPTPRQDTRHGHGCLFLSRKSMGTLDFTGFSRWALNHETCHWRPL